MGTKSSQIRLTVQILFFVIIALIAVNHVLEESGSAIPLVSNVSLHAVCPFGGVVSLYTYITDGVFVHKIHESSFILMGLVFLLAVAFGPVFCGWICPMGSVQEWFGKLGKKIFKRRYNQFIPKKIDEILRYLRYLVLLWVIYITARSAQLIFQDYDPYFTLFNFWTSDVALSGIIILALVLLLSLFVERPFCKYACPYGAILGVFNLFRIFKIRRNSASCTNCKICDRMCPMNIKVSGSGTISHHQCISCLVCTSEEACPQENTVELSVNPFFSGRNPTLEKNRGSLRQIV